MNAERRFVTRSLAALIAFVAMGPATASAQRAEPNEKTTDPELAEADRLDGEAERLHGEGKYDEATRLAERSLAIREQKLGEEHLDTATSLNNLAMLYQATGNYARAEALYERAVAIREKVLGSDHPDVAASLNNLAMVYGPRGEYARAEPLFERALAIREKALGKDHPDVATSLNNLAMLCRVKGDYARAEPLLERALAIREKALGKDHPDIAVSLVNLASLYRDKGDYARAEPLLVRALAIFEKALGKDHPNVATGLNNLAYLYDSKGDYARAEPLYERALAIREKTLGKDHPAVATSLNNLASLYDDRADYARAESFYERALAIWEKVLGKDHPEVATSLNNLAHLYCDKGDYARAEPFYERALAILEKALGTDHPKVAASLNNLATLATTTGDYPRAIRLRSRAAGIREQHLGIYLGAGSEAQKRAYMNLLTDETHSVVSLHVQAAPQSEAALRLAVTTILRRKGRVMDETAAGLVALRRYAPAEARAVLEELALNRAALAKLVLGGVGRDVDGYRAKVEAAKAEVQSLEEELAKHSADFAREREPVTIERVQAVIPAGSALVEIAWYQPFDVRRPKKDEWGTPRYVAYVLGREGPPQWVDLGEAAALDKVIHDARSALSDPRRDAREVGRALYQAVVKPLVPLLGDARDVVISPDGAFSLVPLGAAIDEKGRYFLETRGVHYVTSGRELLRVEAERSSDRVVIVADPAFDEAGSEAEVTRGLRSSDFGSLSFRRLPGTRNEAEALGRMLGQATVLTGGKATERAVKELAGPRILHLATHGFFLSDQERSRGGGRGMVAVTSSGAAEIYKEDPLLRSGLAFAGANTKASGEDDGIITAEEAKGLDLYGTKLVVLSACDTGVGEVENGQGVYGLRRALVLAGAETQVMSLWKVDDEATRELMVAYYQRLLAGEGRAEALRAVQLGMMRRKTTSHPAYWAAFVVSGNAKTMEGQPAPLPQISRGPRGCACRAGADGEAGKGETAGWGVLLVLCGGCVGARRRRFERGLRGGSR